MPQMITGTTSADRAIPGSLVLVARQGDSDIARQLIETGFNINDDDAF